MLLIPFRPFTATGVGSEKVVCWSPSWPETSSPLQVTELSIRRAHVCEAPADTARAGVALGVGAAQAKKESNRQVMERWFETIDAKQTDNLAGVDAADIEMTTPMGLSKGTETHAYMTKMFAAAFPNFKQRALSGG